MQTVPGTVAHPGHIIVPLCGGEQSGIVRPWSMAQRRDLRPRILALLDKVGSLESTGTTNASLASLFLEGEDELASIARASLTLPDDLAWDDLAWADLPTIIQAVWDANFAAENGLMGKLTSLLASAFQKTWAQQAPANTPQSVKQTSSRPS